MAVGPGELPNFYPIEGVRAGVASAGIKKPGRKDLVVFELAEGARTAGVFTQNAFCAAPVQVARAHLHQTAPRYWVINTGNANAGTGEPGLRDAETTCKALADLTGVKASEVLPFSTGVIGEKLPIERLTAALPEALANLGPDNWAEAASGIMTTDTRPKGASAQVECDGGIWSVSGISKGAGMICPNMATMLAFVATDAPLDQAALEWVLREATERSFNRITVDGDTSTNDSCMLVATGRHPRFTMDNQGDWAPLANTLIQVFRELAQAIVRDGEGATKFVTIQVDEAATSAEALDVAYTVAHSPLVKTALYASDPNWGRILAAVGRAGIDALDVGGVNIWLDDVQIVRQGGRAETYTEEAGQAVMDKEAFVIRIALGRGRISETLWTTDLSHEYVTINAEYRT
ncbi:MAG: bifunctional glutamate N-acetyltransferase/amino-acid acetyltransferase ArgJ [Gammaproteobacteria bacterium]|nr:MAG: bifunctional glutamate N-acetyltransferase/amino-acid acetyltransferase ArgJ [Gammaproteobacteria bacterium]